MRDNGRLEGMVETEGGWRGCYRTRFVSTGIEEEEREREREREGGGGGEEEEQEMRNISRTLT